MNPIKTEFVLREAQYALGKVPPGKSPYRELAAMLMGFETWTRDQSIQIICNEFKLDPLELKENVKLEEFDEAAELRMLNKKSITLSQYIDMIGKQKKRLNKKEWNYYNGEKYCDPDLILMTCIYDLLRHTMWKLTDNSHDISTIALIEHGWNDAMEQSMKKRVKLKKPIQ